MCCTPREVTLCGLYTAPLSWYQIFILVSSAKEEARYIHAFVDYWTRCNKKCHCIQRSPSARVFWCRSRWVIKRLMVQTLWILWWRSSRQILFLFYGEQVRDGYELTDCCIWICNTTHPQLDANVQTVQAVLIKYELRSCYSIAYF